MDKPFCFSVKAVVIDDQQRCLVLKRSEQSRTSAGKWDLPGGKCDPGESLTDALRREVQEETGLEVRLRRVVGSTQAELPDCIVAYLLLEATPTSALVQLSEEHDEFQWWPRARLGELDMPTQFREFLKNYAAGAKEKSVRPSTDWYGEQISHFRKMRPQYEELAQCLIRVLKQGASRLGLHPMVQARAKTIASFAEKIIRKNYTDPFKQMTDLCGARVILHTLDNVAAMDRFVEQNFHVFREDSGDKLESLAASQFGYLSRHYVVAFKSGTFPPSMVPEHLLGLKAELQVRTILQHGWADIAHELSYKNRFKLPRRWEREFARLAALLEEADQDFNNISVGLEEYAASYDKSLPPERVQEEMANLAIVLKADPKNTDIAHRLAKFAMVLGAWDRAIAELRPLADTGPAALLRDLGVSLCKQHKDKPYGQDFAEGQAFLQQALDRDPKDVDAWAALGGTWRAKEKAAASLTDRATCRAQAREHYRRAFAIDPGNPYPLGNYIEFELADHPDVDIASFFQPALETASRRCRQQIEVGVNLPWAYFDLSKFQLLLRQPYAALGYYAAGVADSSSAFPLDSALKSFDTLAIAQESLPGFDWSRDFLRVAKASKFGKTESAESGSASEGPRLQAPVVIISGYCDRGPTSEHREFLLAAFQGIRATLIGGGTQAGVSALVGDLQAAYPAAVHAIGYVPNELPKDAQLDHRYLEHRLTSGNELSPRQSIQYWDDLHHAGVPRDKVKLLAIGGGSITACECQMALALGVPVAIIEIAPSEAGKSLAEYPWSMNALLHRIPAEPGVLREFLEM